MDPLPEPRPPSGFRAGDRRQIRVRLLSAVQLGEKWWNNRHPRPANHPFRASDLFCRRHRPRHGRPATTVSAQRSHGPDSPPPVSAQPFVRISTTVPVQPVRPRPPTRPVHGPAAGPVCGRAPTPRTHQEDPMRFRTPEHPDRRQHLPVFGPDSRDQRGHLSPLQADIVRTVQIAMVRRPEHVRPDRLAWAVRTPRGEQAHPGNHPERCLTF